MNQLYSTKTQWMTYDPIKAIHLSIDHKAKKAQEEIAKEARQLMEQIDRKVAFEIRSLAQKRRHYREQQTKGREK